MFKNSVEIDLSLLDTRSLEYIRDEFCQQIRILLLNCSDPELEFLKNVIEKDKNIKVIGMARNAHEARNMVKALDPDLIIMDILGPQSGGIEFLKRLNRFYPRPVLLVSPLTKIPFNLFLSIFDTGVIDIIDKDTLILFENILSSHDFFISKVKTIASNFFCKDFKKSKISN